jgi:hypothetical protein
MQSRGVERMRHVRGMRVDEARLKTSRSEERAKRGGESETVNTSNVATREEKTRESRDEIANTTHPTKAPFPLPTNAAGLRTKRKNGRRYHGRSGVMRLGWRRAFAPAEMDGWACGRGNRIIGVGRELNTLHTRIMAV